MLKLKEYKIQNHVLNLNEEAKSVYAQIADYESRLENVQKDIEANAGALKSIDDKFNANDRQYLDSKMTLIHQDILQSEQQINDLNDKYVHSGFDTTYLIKIDALKKVIAEQINQLTDKYILNPLNEKESLVTEKMQLEIKQEIAKNSVHSIQSELDKLNKQFNLLVPDEAVIQADEGDISVASQEYLDVLNRYNESNLRFNSAVKLKLVETSTLGENSLLKN